jgi:hypothetical protein
LLSSLIAIGTIASSGLTSTRRTHAPTMSIHRFAAK